jgi:cation transport regulator
MPYSEIEELPDPIREDLPTEAQEVYKDAFNTAEEYNPAEKTPTDESVEDTAHRMAREAVKREYEKKDGRWVPKKR